MKKYFVLMLFLLLFFVRVDASEDSINIKDFFQFYQKENDGRQLQSSTKDGYFKYILSEPTGDNYDINSYNTFFTLQNYESSETLTLDILRKMDFGNPNFPGCKNNFKYGSKKEFIYQLVSCGEDIKLARIITKDLLFSLETDSNTVIDKNTINTYMQYFLKNYKKFSYEKKTGELVKDENWVLIKMLPQIISQLDNGTFSYGLDKNKKLRFSGIFQENSIPRNHEDYVIKQFDGEIENLLESIRPKPRFIDISFDGQTLTFPIYKTSNGEETFEAPRKEGSYYTVYGQSIQKEDILSFLEYIKKSYYSGNQDTIGKKAIFRMTFH